MVLDGSGEAKAVLEQRAFVSLSLSHFAFVLVMKQLTKRDIGI
jgi:hypothetical protein